MQLKRKRVNTDKVIFNGNNLSSLVMCKVHRRVLPPIKAEFEHIPGRHGEAFKYAYREGFDQPVEITLRTEHRREVAEARHRLAAMLYTDEPAPLYLPDDPTKYLMAIVSGDTDLGEITDDCPTTTINFHVGDPAYYGRSRVFEITTSSETAIEVGGNLPAYLHIEVTPKSSISSWRVTNVSTGEFVEVQQSMTKSSSLEIDMKTEHATVNGSTCPVSLESDFFAVEGRTSLKISSGTAKLKWVERWL